MTTFRIEKETRWNSTELKSVVMYFVWAGTKCLSATNSEEEAMKVYEAAKKHYIEPTSEIIKEETIG